MSAASKQVSKIMSAASKHVSKACQQLVNMSVKQLVKQEETAYVIIRQHTSAYVSIRQHTSA
jgi:hypothetical protein